MVAARTLGVGALRFLLFFHLLVGGLDDRFNRLCRLRRRIGVALNPEAQRPLLFLAARDAVILGYLSHRLDAMCIVPAASPIERAAEAIWFAASQ